MANIISIHSFHHGAGKSIIAANVASLLAADGWRVGLVDANLQSPSLATIFGLNKVAIPHSLNDYLAGKCDIEQASYDVSVLLKAVIKGRLFLIPANPFSPEIVHMLRHQDDLKRLSDGFRDFIATCALDVVFVDAHAGIHEEVLTVMAIADITVIVIRHDLQDLQGASLVVDVARGLSLPHVLLVGNEMLPFSDLAQMQAQLESLFNCSVAAVLPYSQELMALSYSDIFVFRYPDHPITNILRHIATTLAMPSLSKTESPRCAEA